MKPGQAGGAIARHSPADRMGGVLQRALRPWAAAAAVGWHGESIEAKPDL